MIASVSSSFGAFVYFFLFKIHSSLQPLSAQLLTNLRSDSFYDPGHTSTSSQVSSCRVQPAGRSSSVPPLTSPESAKVSVKIHGDSVANDTFQTHQFSSMRRISILSSMVRYIDLSKSCPLLGVGERCRPLFHDVLGEFQHQTPK